jgi:hypothetical protein
MAKMPVITAALIAGCILALEPPLKLGAGQSWYDQQPTTASELEGILDYQPGTGRLGVPTERYVFRLIRQDKTSGKVISTPVHAPGHEAVLALNVGQRVRIEAKAVSEGEGDTRKDVLWLGKLTPLGAAPYAAFTEIKPLARTNSFGVFAPRANNELTTQVLRSGNDVAKALSLGGAGADREATTMLASTLGVKSIDWKKEMVIHLGMLNTRGGLVLTHKLEVTRLEVHERGVTVHWKLEPQAQRGAAALTETILVPRIDGEVTFKKEESKDEPGSKQPPAPAKVPLKK